MTLAEKIKSQFSASPVMPTTEESISEVPGSEDANAEEKAQMKATETSAAAGVSMIEASQAVWGKLGWRLIIAGLAMIMILFELDNSTIYVYNNYSTSSFSALSTLGSLSTANTILFAVVKPPIAKLSNVVGRGYTLVFCISMYLISYILMASATNISTYAAGLMLYSIGQSGTNVMTNVIISDITTPRWRGFALGISYFPFLITPWVSAFIVDSVVNGIGWRWGIGMFAILMPFGASFIITALVFYQRKAKKMGLLASQTKTTIYGFCSDIDLGGIILFVSGFAMLLLPITIAGSLENGWRTPWVIAVMVVGGVLLIALVFYEKFVAVNPVVPVFYFRNATIVLSILMVATDSIGFSCTHTYMYAWASVSHDMSPRNATFYVYTNGVIQCLIGIGAGYIMLVTGRFKWLTMCGVVIRLIGYGVMLRLRGQDNSIAELFIQQVIQGIGSGIIQTTLLVPPQVVVPHSHIALVLALVFSASFLGSSIGSAIAGAIYTNTMRPALWKFLGDSGTQELVDALYNSITDVLPDWGTPERIAINYAYSDVIKGMTYTALGASIPAIIMCFFLPNLALPNDRNALAAAHFTPPADEESQGSRDDSPHIKSAE